MKEKLLYFLVLVPLLFIALALQIYKVEPFESFSLKFNDVNFALQEKSPSQEIVFVAVDERSVNHYGRWPWQRDKIAEGISHLRRADVVLMDMIFSEYTTSQDDAALADAISGLQNSVCGFFLRHDATQTIEPAALDILGDSSLDLLQSQAVEYGTPRFVGATHSEMNILPLLEACTLSGSFSTLAASDHLFRSYPIAFYYENLLYPSLGVQGLRLRLNQDIQREDASHVKIGEHKINLDAKGFVRLNYYDYEDYNIVSFLDVATQKIAPEYFEGKIVIIGVTDVGSGDIVSTPIGSIPGPLLHYTFLSNLLEGHLISEKAEITTALVVLMVLLPFLALLLMKKVVYRALVYLVVYGLVTLYIRSLFVEEMLYIDLFYPLLALLLSAVVFEALAFYLQEKGGRFLRDAFSSYLSADLLAQLIKNPEALSLGGESKELSILFSDIRSFTTLSESMTPQELIKLLNRYFTPMTNAVLENGGMLDKYIGDAVMAFFNAPVTIKNHADAACKCALEMIESLDKLNAELAKEGVAPIHIGVGINTAEVVVGNMGSDTRFNYTVIGDGVNLASRLEGLTKNYGIDILISEFTVAQLKGDFIYRKIEPVRVKGKEKAVLLYQLMPSNARSKEIKVEYDKALELYIQGDAKAAQEIFGSLVKRYNDSLSQYFFNNIQEDQAWDVHTMTTK